MRGLRGDHVAAAAIVGPSCCGKRARDVRNIDFPATHTVDVRIEDGVVYKIEFNAESSPQLDGKGVVPRQADIRDGEFRLPVIGTDTVAHQIVLERRQVLRGLNVLSIFLVGLDCRCLARANACDENERSTRTP